MFYSFVYNSVLSEVCYLHNCIGCSCYICYVCSGKSQQSRWATDSRQSLCGSLPLQHSPLPSLYAAHAHIKRSSSQCLCETSQKLPQEWRTRPKYCGLVNAATSFWYYTTISCTHTYWDTIILTGSYYSICRNGSTSSSEWRPVFLGWWSTAKTYLEQVSHL